MKLIFFLSLAFTKSLRKKNGNESNNILFLRRRRRRMRRRRCRRHLHRKLSLGRTAVAYSLVTLPIHRHRLFLSINLREC